MVAIYIFLLKLCNLQFNFLISFNFCSRHSFGHFYDTQFLLRYRRRQTAHTCKWMVIIRNDCTVLCVLPFSFSENSSFHISCIPHVLFFLDVSFYNDALAADFVWRVVLIVAVVLRISEYKNDILYISSF